MYDREVIDEYHGCQYGYRAEQYCTLLRVKIQCGENSMPKGCPLKAGDEE
jgi:hypothetical protein